MIPSSDIKKKAFRDFYKKHRVDKPLTDSQYNAFLADLLRRLATAIVEEGIEVKLIKVGKIRVKSEKMPILDKEGNLTKLRPDWVATKQLWATKYPGLSKEELKAIPHKPLVFHENEHSDGEHYRHYWDKTTCYLKLANLYKFRASRCFSRMISKVVKNPNRTVFYYG